MAIAKSWETSPVQMAKTPQQRLQDRQFERGTRGNPPQYLDALHTSTESHEQTLEAIHACTVFLVTCSP